MGLMDKMKDQAGQLAEKAQQGMEKGKDRIEEIQAMTEQHLDRLEAYLQTIQSGQHAANAANPKRKGK